MELHEGAFLTHTTLSPHPHILPWPVLSLSPSFSPERGRSELHTTMADHPKKETWQNNNKKWNSRKCKRNWKTKVPVQQQFWLNLKWRQHRVLKSAAACIVYVYLGFSGLFLVYFWLTPHVFCRPFSALVPLSAYPSNIHENEPSIELHPLTTLCTGG